MFDEDKKEEVVEQPKAPAPEAPKEGKDGKPEHVE